MTVFVRWGPRKEAINAGILTTAKIGEIRKPPNAANDKMPKDTTVFPLYLLSLLKA